MHDVGTRWEGSLERATPCDYTRVGGDSGKGGGDVSIELSLSSTQQGGRMVALSPNSLEQDGVPTEVAEISEALHNLISRQGSAGVTGVSIAAVRI